MDPFFQRQIYKCPYYPTPMPRLTPYQETPSISNPGTGMSNLISTPMVPLYGETLYTNSKEMDDQKVGGLENEQIVSPSDPKDIINMQKGFGAMESEDNSNDNDNDINTGGLQKINESVLKAFEKPVIKTSTFNYEPKKRKADTMQSVDLSVPKIKKKLKGKLKFV